MEWLGKRIRTLPTSCISCTLNPQGQLDSLCVCGICERTMSVPTKENALATTAGHWGQEHSEEGQIRVWTVPTAGQEISLLSIGGPPSKMKLGQWLKARKRMLTAETQEKHLLLFLYFDLLCHWFWSFFFSLLLWLLLLLLYPLKFLRNFV